MKKLPVYESYLYTNMRDLVESVAERYPNRDAFSFRRNPHDESAARISFPLFRDDVRALGTEFAARGYTGKHCAIVGKLSYAWVCSFFALLSIGAVAVPLDKDWHGEDLADTAANADCEVLLYDAALLQKASMILQKTGIAAPICLDGKASADGETLDDLLTAGKKKLRAGDRSYFEASYDPAKLSILVFTSGTTGSGKGVMLSQKGLMADLYAGLKQVSLSKKTVAVLPPHHTYGCNVGLVAHVAAGSEVYLSDGLRYVQKELRNEHPEHLTLVPLFIETFYRKILSTAKEQGKYDLLRRMMKVSNTARRFGIDLRRSLFRSVLDSFGGKLRLIVSGGAPLSQEIVSTFDAIGITILNGYGITECSPLISVNHNEQRLRGAGCVGTPLVCNEIKLRDPNANGEGEICVKGDNVMLGYYKNDAATAEAFDDADFFRTGDYGRFDADGNLYITGRLKNLIILSNGKNVYPEEIESALSAVGGILEIVVYEGKSRRGAEHNAIVAEIYPDADYLKKNGIEDARAYFQAAIDNFNRTAVAYKKIALLRLRENEFPKNTLRKILRFQMDMSID